MTHEARLRDPEEVGRGIAETPAQRLRRARSAGYLYQDLIGALMLVRLLVDGYQQVRIETAKGDEVFDDHAVTFADERRRLVQVKYSLDGGALAQGDLANQSGRLPISDLMASARKEIKNGGAEFRVFATWRPPEATARTGFLCPASGVRIDPRFQTSLWRLDAEAIWPPDGPPRWDGLRGYERPQFINFCDRFLLELEGAPMSKELQDPGAMEAHLLDVIRDELEVERPPNRRDPVDVAAALIYEATAARSRVARDFVLDDALRAAKLVVDDGRLAAAFPLETPRFVRTPLVDQLLAEAKTDGVVLVIGSPGAGKSWALESVVGPLKDGGCVVARHYCFLEPGDPQAQWRVAVGTMCSNLIGELRRDERLGGIRTGLARDTRALEHFLQKATGRPTDVRDDPSAPGDDQDVGLGSVRIVLIVDGIDHVARLDPITGPRDVDEFVLALASLTLPAGVTLIVGSQPGSFLDPLRLGAREIHPVRFGRKLVTDQLERLGLLSALEERGLARERECEDLISAFVERSEGNPLYVRYLALETLGALAAGTSLPEILRAIPGAPADLQAYYERLLGSGGGVVAEQLAVLEFAVDAAELTEILPMWGRSRIDEALRDLRPILVEAPGRGLRIYHESVRRFVIDRVRATGTLQALVDPVVSWLDRRGFFADDRSYRWLLPTLRRAGRAAECLARIGPDFVARSVAELHPGIAVDGNIRTAAYAARDVGDLAKLAAIAELRTAATTSYEERVEETEDYARTVTVLRGADALAQRLFYDGRAVRPRPIGLRMCALVDEAGGNAPWSEYLALPSESEGIRDTREQEPLDGARGWMRLGTPQAVADAIGAWFKDNADAPEWYARGVAALLREIHGLDALGTVIATEGLPSKVGLLFQMELVRALHDRGGPEAAAAGRHALALGASDMDLVDLLDCGVPVSDLVGAASDPAGLVASLLADRHQPDALAVNDFVSSVLVHAAAGMSLGPLRELLAGEGWYRRWLRYVVDLGRVRQGRLSIISAFEEVAADTRPFAGKPRAIDLYVIARTVGRTLRRGFLMASLEERRRIVPRLLDVAVGTTGRLDGTPIGAFPLADMLEILEGAPDPELIRLVADAMRRTAGDVYATHAEDALRMARLWKAVGDDARAEEEWERACGLLAAYGYHKDITIFTLLDGVEAIARVDRPAARERALRLRRLTELAAAHTDGDETRHAPNAWLRSLVKIDPIIATRTLARTVIRDARVPSTVEDELFGAVLASAPGSVPPIARHLLWRCVPARQNVTERLAVVSELLTAERERGERAFGEAAADIEGDAEGDVSNTSVLRQFATDHGLAHPGVGLTPPDPPRPKKSEDAPRSASPVTHEEGPFLPADATPAALVLAIRRLKLDRWGASVPQGAFAREFAGHLRRLVVTSGEEMIITLIQELARSRPFYDSRALFEELAGDLRSEHPAAAAETYVLAWCAARRDWQVFGGPEDADLLDRATELDPRRALQRIADECAEAVDRYEYSPGVAQRIVEVLAHLGKAKEACAAWDEAFAVVERRLPDLGADRDVFLLPDAPDSVDQVRAYGELLGAFLTHPVFARRAAAASAVVELSGEHPDIARVALDTAIGPDTVLSDRIVALQSGLAVGIVPSDRRALGDIASSAPFTAAALAARTLEAAGEAAPGPRPYIWTTPRATGAEIAEVMELDYANRTERIARLWEGFPELVADAYMRQRRADDRHERIRRSQAEQQSSVSAPWVPPLRLHDWYREMVEVALGESLWGLREHLKSRGRWSGTRENGLLRVVAPEVRVSQARSRSRIVRPAGPLPEDVKIGRSEPAPEVMGPFAGWMRAAYVESHAKAVDEARSGGVETTVRSGLVRRDVPADEPIARAERAIRWYDIDDIEARHDEAPLARLWHQMDCTAWDWVLAPAAEVLERLGLVPSSLNQPLDLDGDGGVAMALRYWWMWPHAYEYGPPTPMLFGAALFMRADTWARVRAELGDFEMLTALTSIDL